MISRKNKVIYLFILFGTLIRIVMAIIHCTHMDDIGVVNYLIHLLRTTKGDEIDIAKRFSDFWTYGPFQILFTQKLINENIGYSLNIFLGRLPSLICSVLYIFIIFRLLYKTKTDEKNLILLIICLISLSWENIIYSAQMEPYSIGILFSAIIVYLVV